MTEQRLKDLGFYRTLVPIEESGDEKDFHYYTLYIGDVCLISNASDEAGEEGWKVSIFHFPYVEISDWLDLKGLVDILRLNTKEQ